MKLQIERIKDVLEKIEHSHFPYRVYFALPSNCRIEGTNEATVTYYHVCLMLEMGLIKGTEDEDNGTIEVERLTWKGHELLANSKSPLLWKEFQRVSNATGGFSIDIAQFVLASLASKLATGLIN
jgi:hypothetical protein